MKLTNITKYWTPIPETIDYICNTYKNKCVLEIGPGYVPLPISTSTIDWDYTVDGIKLDMDVDLLPYEDNSFDFVYSRHVLEYLQNPDFAFKEIIRVSKNGFIETPSPLIECTNGTLITLLISVFINMVKTFL
jgi:SAM-dependent methyltransferase